MYLQRARSQCLDFNYHSDVGFSLAQVNRPGFVANRLVNQLLF